MIIINQYAVQDWTITPVEKPAGTSEPNWLMVLSGVGLVTLQGNVTDAYSYETLLINPNLEAPLTYALGKYPTPQGLHSHHELAGRPVFFVDQCAPFAAISSFYDTETGSSVHVGFAVDTWRLHDNTASQLFSGIEVDIALLNKTVMHRVSYQITLVGRIGHERLPAKAGQPEPGLIP